MRTARIVDTLLAAALIAGVPALASAQTPTPQTAPRMPAPAGQSAAVTLTATISAINAPDRLVTFKSKEGDEITVYCGPEIQRFNELKVGDKVTFEYREAIVFAIAKAGSAAPPAGGSAVIRSAGDKPAGMVAKRQTAEVTITAIDPKTPSVTIQRPDGATAVFRVQNPKNLEGVKVGDKVQITYSQALAISVK